MNSPACQLPDHILSHVAAKVSRITLHDAVGQPIQHALYSSNRRSRRLRQLAQLKVQSPTTELLVAFFFLTPSIAMSFQALDTQSLALVIELQLTEIDSCLKGKHKVGEISDYELAMGMYRMELASMSQYLANRRLCQSIARAVEQDADTIAAHTQVEEQAVNDRRVAFRFSPEPSKISVAQKPMTADALLGRVKSLAISHSNASSGSVKPESSSWAAKRTATTNIKRKCVSCHELVPSTQSVHLPCSHDYCRDCVTELFKISTTDESLFPPRCCRMAIPIGLCMDFLSSGIVETFRAKEVEYRTPNRTYCHGASCSSFVPPSLIKNDVAECPRCGDETCTICKGERHNGDCPKDSAVQEVLRLASESGWQRCRNCRQMVELDMGCYHMSEKYCPVKRKRNEKGVADKNLACFCKAEFCYVCGEPWKTCSCAQWDENRLVARANAIVDRGGYRPGFAARQQAVARERRNLIENHQCDHGVWGSRMGRNRCEECYDTLPDYIYECRQCHLLACRRCRFNRL